MDDDGAVVDVFRADSPTMKASCWFAADGLGKSKGQETDACHEEGNDADKADLFTPRTLRLGCSYA